MLYCPLFITSLKLNPRKQQESVNNDNDKDKDNDKDNELRTNDLELSRLRDLQWSPEVQKDHLQEGEPYDRPTHCKPIFGSHVHHCRFG